MPLGWYLAQGLIPLTASDSDDEEGPCELPDGRLVCGPHGLVICGKCCVDYSFMDDVLSHDSNDVDEDSDRLGSEVDANRLCSATNDSNATRSSAPCSNNQPTAPETPQLPADLFGPGLRRGTGRVFPTKFVPPSAAVTPLELFSGRRNHGLITRQGNVWLTKDGIS
jgi:ribonuclease HI